MAFAGKPQLLYPALDYYPANAVQVDQQNMQVSRPMTTYDLRHSQGPEYWASYPPEYDCQRCITSPLAPFFSDDPGEPSAVAASYDTPPPPPYANIHDGAIQQPAMAQNATDGEELAVATAASHSADSPYAFQDEQSPHLPFHLRNLLRSDQGYLNTIRIVLHTPGVGAHDHEEYLQQDCDYPRKEALQRLYDVCGALGPRLKFLAMTICLPETAVPHVPFVAQQVTDMCPNLEELLIYDTLCRVEDDERLDRDEYMLSLRAHASKQYARTSLVGPKLKFFVISKRSFFSLPMHGDDVDRRIREYQRVAYVFRMPTTHLCKQRPGTSGFHSGWDPVDPRDISDGTELDIQYTAFDAYIKFPNLERVFIRLDGRELYAVTFEREPSPPTSQTPASSGFGFTGGEHY